MHQKNLHCLVYFEKSTLHWGVLDVISSDPPCPIYNSTLRTHLSVKVNDIYFFAE